MTERLMTSPAEQLAELATACGLEIIDRATLPGRRARLSPVPGSLEAAVHSHLCATYPGGVYTHQAAAIESSMAGEDVCLATPTASGKSLVFLALSADILMRDPAARVLALYPAKALIKDQLNKWRSMLKPLGHEPGYLDGGVPVPARLAILAEHRALLMTPDVAHAWLMSHLGEPEVHKLLASLRLVVLDEAHVYDGAFGTNMAYFLRRLEAVARRFQYITSTATIGDAEGFIEKLTGRRSRVFSVEDDGSASAEKGILLARCATTNSFTALADLLLRVARADTGRFLAFADSRKMVEQLVVVAMQRAGKGGDDRASTLVPAIEWGEETAEDEERTVDAAEDQNKTVDAAEDAETGAAAGNETTPADVAREEPTAPLHLEIQPYRAGYEEGDRQAIQEALEEGRLAGVVSTSALELGLDIGEINVVLLLGSPPSVKAFWQRLGRAGRRHPGVCLIVDTRHVIAHVSGALHDYIRRPAEPGWLYLDNHFIQFTHALCAAAEADATGETGYSRSAYQSVPPQFLRFLDGDIQPAHGDAAGLLALEQRVRAHPQYAFPLRTGAEKRFEVRVVGGPGEKRLGTLTLSQVLREAYPGAIYYYMARPFRVRWLKHRAGEIRVVRAKRWTTSPRLQSIAFPDFQQGLLRLLTGPAGFIAEVELQVSERVVGFEERRGPSRIECEYGPSSRYSSRPVVRFYETTGVCWFFHDSRPVSEAVAPAILEAFCALCGIEARDVGSGVFSARPSPIGDDRCRGECIYDSTLGSLRLTQQLVERFDEVLTLAADGAGAPGAPRAVLQQHLDQLRRHAITLRPAPVSPVAAHQAGDDEWTLVIAPGEKGMFIDADVVQEVQVRDVRLTPDGLMYELVSDPHTKTWMVRASAVVPIKGVSRLLRVNRVTGAIRALSAGDPGGYPQSSIL